MVRRAQELSLAELAAATRGVAEKAREGGLAAEDVEGGTITLSNLGMLGVEAGTPLVTAPQAASAHPCWRRPLTAMCAVTPAPSPGRKPGSTECFRAG